MGSSEAVLVDRRSSQPYPTEHGVAGFGHSPSISNQELLRCRTWSRSSSNLSPQPKWKELRCWGEPGVLKSTGDSPLSPGQTWDEPFGDFPLLPSAKGQSMPHGYTPHVRWPMPVVWQKTTGSFQPSVVWLTWDWALNSHQGSLTAWSWSEKHPQGFSSSYCLLFPCLFYYMKPHSAPVLRL